MYYLCLKHIKNLNPCDIGCVLYKSFSIEKIRSYIRKKFFDAEKINIGFYMLSEYYKIDETYIWTFNRTNKFKNKTTYLDNVFYLNIISKKENDKNEKTKEC